MCTSYSTSFSVRFLPKSKDLSVVRDGAAVRRKVFAMYQNDPDMVVIKEALPAWTAYHMLKSKFCLQARIIPLSSHSG